MKNTVASLLGTITLLCMTGCASSWPPSLTERTFIARVSRVLSAKYPTMQVAQRHGYMPITDRLDAEHTYNLTDMDFRDVALDHPNFLWYDRAGKLVGVDYEYPKDGYAKPPMEFPVDPSRWTSIDAHMHLAYELNGKTVYAEVGSSTDVQKYLPSGATLRWKMDHPAAWDLALWLVPNPGGAFADENPLVK